MYEILLDQIWDVTTFPVKKKKKVRAKFEVKDIIWVTDDEYGRGPEYLAQNLRSVTLNEPKDLDIQI